MDDQESTIRYQHLKPSEAQAEIVVPDAIPADERLWVPQTEGISFRPLCLSISGGYWVNVLRVRKQGMISRHRHPNGVHGYVIKGRWRYLEHAWEAKEGSYVYEPPGEVHTLVVPGDVEEMITLFQVNGLMQYVDLEGKATGHDDVFSKIALCRRHFAECGLGADHVEQFIR